MAMQRMNNRTTVSASGTAFESMVESSGFTLLRYSLAGYFLPVGLAHVFLGVAPWSCLHPRVDGSWLLYLLHTASVAKSHAFAYRRVDSRAVLQPKRLLLALPRNVARFFARSVLDGWDIKRWKRSRFICLMYASLSRPRSWFRPHHSPVPAWIGWLTGFYRSSNRSTAKANLSGSRKKWPF